MELETPSPPIMENSIQIYRFNFRMTSLTKNLDEFSTGVVFLFFSSLFFIYPSDLNSVIQYNKVSVRVRVVQLDPKSVSEGN